MRPFPESRHLIAAGVLILVAAASTYSAWTDWRFSDEQLRALTALHKRQQVELYRHDCVLGPSGAWRFESPAFQSALAALGRLGGDELTPFRILTAITVLLYLGGMYALLCSQTRSWSVSVFVSILSMTVVHALGGGFWGVGSLAASSPSGLITAATPLVVLAYMHQQDKRSLLLVFGSLGLLANLHVPSAGNLTLVLLIVYLVQRRFSLRTAGTALACGATALLGAGPILWYRWELARRLRPAGSPVSAAAVQHAVGLTEWDALYPRLLEGVWTWLFFIAVLLVLSGVILARSERFQIRNFAVWVWWIFAAVVVTFIFQGAAQLWGLAWGRPATVGYARASALVFLALWVLLAHAITTLFRVARGHRALARWGCAVFAALWMVPSDNVRPLRYAATDTVTLFLKEDSKPRYVQKRHERYADWQEMRHIGLWARQHTNPGAVFVCDSAELRFYSQRSVLATHDDVDCLYRYAPWGLADWAAALDRQHRAFGAGGLDSLESLVKDLSAGEPLQGATQWYVVLPAASPVARELPVVPCEGWGRFYVVCRIR